MGFCGVSHDQGAGTTTAITLDAIAFAFIAPGIHGVHRKRAAASVALHLLAPAAGALVGALYGVLFANCLDIFATQPCNTGNVGTGAEIGFAFGGGMAMLIDALVLSWEPTDLSDASSRTSSGWIIAPNVSSRGGGLTLGRTF